MARANKGYEIRPMVCDWALDIPMGYTHLFCILTAEIMQNWLRQFWSGRTHIQTRRPHTRPLSPRRTSR